MADTIFGKSHVLRGLYEGLLIRADLRTSLVEDPEDMRPVRVERTVGSMRRGTSPVAAIEKQRAKAGEEFANGGTEHERGEAAAENRAKTGLDAQKGAWETQLFFH